MNILAIVLIFLFILLTVLGIEFIIKLKKSEGKLIEDVRKTLMIRLNIMTGIIVVMAIIYIINAVLRV